MNVTDYTYLMNKPDAITEKQADALGSVLNEFPYFQSARALRLKGLYSQNSFKYNYALKVTAAYTTDRSVLFDFITSEAFTAIQSEYYDRKLQDLLEIKVVDSEIISVQEDKKITEVKIDPIEQSILNSIKEATSGNFKEVTEIEEKPILVIDESVVDNEEPVISADPTVIDEEPVTPEEAKIELIDEQAILDSFKEVTAADLDEPLNSEEPKIEIITEEAILDSFTEVETPTEESVETEEKETETIFEEPVIIPAKEATRTFFEEVVDDEIPEVRIDPIEESIYISLQEATTVIFEEAKKEEETPVEAVKEEEKPEIIKVPETVKIAEENLEIGKPLDFSVSEKHSFQEWLQLARTEPIDRTVEGPKEEPKKQTAEKTAEPVVQPAIIDEEKKKKAEIINKFIETNPKISPIKQTAITPAVQFDINKEENSYLMTETLARVYLEQKKYTKAIQAYEILILKYPEKISFFADRISDIKILQQNNNNN